MPLYQQSSRLPGVVLLLVVSQGLVSPVGSQGMESVGQIVREDAVRRVLEANLKITEARVNDLQTKVDAMKICYTQGKMYTPTGCVALPPQKKNCTCND